MSLEINKKDLLWLAGLIEGDGCIWSQGKRAAIGLGLTDEDVIKKAACLLNCSYYSRPPHKEDWKPVYAFHIKSEKAIAIMDALYPYMGIRRQHQILKTKELWEMHCQESFSVNKRASLINRDVLIDEYRNSSHRKLANKYDLSFSTIQKILKGEFKPYVRKYFSLNVLESDLSEIESWLAGILEAEGSFLKPVPSSPNSPIITIQSTDHDIAEKVAILFGMSVGEYQPKKITKSGSLPKKVYIVHLRGKKAVCWMKSLKSSMGLRRQQQIDNALSAYDPDKNEKAVLRRCVLSNEQICEAEENIRNGLSLRKSAELLDVNHTVLRDAIRRKSGIRR